MLKKRAPSVYLIDRTRAFFLDEDVVLCCQHIAMRYWKRAQKHSPDVDTQSPFSNTSYLEIVSPFMKLSINVKYMHMLNTITRNERISDHNMMIRTLHREKHITVWHANQRQNLRSSQTMIITEYFA